MSTFVINSRDPDDRYSNNLDFKEYIRDNYVCIRLEDKVIIMPYEIIRLFGTVMLFYGEEENFIEHTKKRRKVEDLLAVVKKKITNITSTLDDHLISYFNRIENNPTIIEEIDMRGNNLSFACMRDAIRLIDFMKTDQNDKNILKRIEGIFKIQYYMDKMINQEPQMSEDSRLYSRMVLNHLFKFIRSMIINQCSILVEYGIEYLIGIIRKYCPDNIKLLYIINKFYDEYPNDNKLKTLFELSESTEEMIDLFFNSINEPILNIKQNLLPILKGISNKNIVFYILSIYKYLIKEECIANDIYVYKIIKIIISSKILPIIDLHQLSSYGGVILYKNNLYLLARSRSKLVTSGYQNPVIPDGINLINNNTTSIVPGETRDIFVFIDGKLRSFSYDNASPAHKFDLTNENNEFNNVIMACGTVKLGNNLLLIRDDGFYLYRENIGRYVLLPFHKDIAFGRGTIVYITSLKYTSLFVTSEGNVYIFGLISNIEIKWLHKVEPRIEKTLIEMIHIHSLKNIKSIKFQKSRVDFGMNMIALDFNGKLWFSGIAYNDEQNLVPMLFNYWGDDYKDEFITEDFLVIPDVHNVVDFDFVYGHVIYLTNDGKLFWFGGIDVNGHKADQYGNYAPQLIDTPNLFIYSFSVRFNYIYCVTMNGLYMISFYQNPLEMSVIQLNDINKQLQFGEIDVKNILHEDEFKCHFCKSIDQSSYFKENDIFQNIYCDQICQKLSHLKF